MRRPLLAVICVAACVAGHTMAQSYHVRMLKKEFTTVVTREAVQATPSWPEESDSPPLPARDAIELASQKCRALAGGDDELRWSLARACLVPSHLVRDKWHWLVEFDGDAQGLGGGSGRPARLGIVVLMDGTVVEPQVAEKP